MEPILAQPPKDPTPSLPAPDQVGDVAATPTSQTPQINPVPPPTLDQANEAQNSAQAANDRREGLRSILTTLSILIMAPLIAFALTAFIFQSYQVDGSSMETTLQNADRLIVIKLPRTIAKITHHPFIPHRGDVIIFNKNDLSQFDGGSQKKQLVKRVIGLPGDRVVVKDGEVTVYNAANPNGFDPDTTLAYGKVIVTTPGAVDITVQKDQIFVMGDNRTNSLDSRIFGPISDQDIVGKLELRIFPFNKLKKF